MISSQLATILSLLVLGFDAAMKCRNGSQLSLQLITANVLSPVDAISTGNNAARSNRVRHSAYQSQPERLMRVIQAVEITAKNMVFRRRPGDAFFAPHLRHPRPATRSPPMPAARRRFLSDGMRAAPPRRIQESLTPFMLHSKADATFPANIIGSIEMAFQGSRAHLGVETQRQWSDLTIARTTAALFGYSRS